MRDLATTLEVPPAWPLGPLPCRHVSGTERSWMVHGVMVSWCGPFLGKELWDSKKDDININDDIDDSTFKHLSIHINSHQFTSIHINSHMKSTSIHIIFQIHLTRTQPLAAHLAAATMVPLGQAKRWPKFSPLSRSVHVKSTTFPLEIFGNGWKWLVASLWMCSTERCWLNPRKIATVPALLETTQTSEFLKFHSWCLGKRQYIAISGVFGQKLQRCPGPECWRLVAVAGKNTSLVKGIHRVVTNCSGVMSQIHLGNTSKTCTNIAKLKKRFVCPVPFQKRCKENTPEFAAMLNVLCAGKMSEAKPERPPDETSEGPVPGSAHHC